MSEQLSERGKDLVKYMPQAVNALADRLIEKLTERVLYGEMPKTNADRIRAMTDEELAKELSFIGDCRCPDGGECGHENSCLWCWQNWLKLEAAE